MKTRISSPIMFSGGEQDQVGEIMPGGGTVPLSGDPLLGHPGRRAGCGPRRPESIPNRTGSTWD